MIPPINNSNPPYTLYLGENFLEHVLLNKTNHFFQKDNIF